LEGTEREDLIKKIKKNNKKEERIGNDIEFWDDRVLRGLVLFITRPLTRAYGSF